MIGTLIFRLRKVLNGFLLGLRFVLNGAGSAYGVGPWRRYVMLRRAQRNAREIDCLSNWRQHILMMEDILQIPKEMPGDVVECGCFNGGSTANLSMACQATGRRYFVCDSFQGLPTPEEYEQTEAPAGLPKQWTYEAGQLSSQGGVEGVRARVAKYGEVDCCTFVPGFFSDTLGGLETDHVVFVFADADLRSSTEDCVLALWPKMQIGAKFFCHEPFSTHVVSLFYDHRWWREHLDLEPPGFFGSGAGIAEVLRPSRIGFALKYSGQEAGRSELELERTHTGALPPLQRGSAVPVRPKDG